MPRFSKSVYPTAPAVGLMLGLAVGIVDSLILLSNWSYCRGAYYLPPLWYLTVTWTWMTACCLTALLFSSPRLGWVRGLALALVGPGLLLVSRTATPMKQAWQLSTLTVILICLATTIVLSIPLARIPIRTNTFWKRWVAGTIASSAILLFLAADIRVADVLSRKQPGPSSGSDPNVVLIFLDTVRYDDSLGSGKRTMPNLTRFAERGALFENAWAPAPWTVPSHFAVFTGVDPWKVPFDPESRTIAYDGPTMAERLYSRGYSTAAVYANPLLTPNTVNSRGYSEISYTRASAVCRSGIGDLLNRSINSDGPRMPFCSPYTASEVTDRAIRFVNRAKKPFFLTVNYLDGHDPYYVPPECRDFDYRVVSRRDRQPVLSASPDSSYRLDMAVAKRVRAGYRRALNCMDRSLGRLLATVDRDPNTIVAIVSDHGEQFGRHGFGGHGNSVYRQVLHVPLVVRLPGAAPIRVTDPVSITDLYLTMIRAADPDRQREPLPLLVAEHRRPVLACYAYLHGPNDEERSGFSVVRDEYHFIHSNRGEELYLYPRDPSELNPVPLDNHGNVADRLREDVLRMKRGARPTAWNALGYLN